MASFNRVNANTFTPRPSEWYQLYRGVVESNYDALAAKIWPGEYVSFDSLLDKLQTTRTHFIGANRFLSRSQIAIVLGISKQTVYRLFRLEIAPEGFCRGSNNETIYCSDDVFHFVRKVYPRHTHIHKQVLLLQIKAALDNHGASHIQALAEWVLHDTPCSILVEGDVT